MLQPRRTHTAVAVAACLSVALTLAGCGDNGDEKAGETKLQVTAGPVKTPVPEALESGAKKPADPDAGDSVRLVRKPSKLPASARKRVSSIDVRPHAERLVQQDTGAIGESGDTGATDPDYEQFIRAVIPLIDSYWAKETTVVAPKATYAPPAHLVQYDDGDGPGCHGQRSEGMRGNAYYCGTLSASCASLAPNRGYCSGDDIVAWDRASLMLPLYHEVGGLATALVLAHEWGHLAQARIYPDYVLPTTERHELQADCFAGAWALEMKRQGRVDLSAFNETLDLFKKIGGEGAAWLDPDSHGNQYQRIRSFTQGFEEDAPGCVGAKFTALLSRIGLD